MRVSSLRTQMARRGVNMPLSCGYCALVLMLTTGVPAVTANFLWNVPDIQSYMQVTLP